MANDNLGDVLSDLFETIEARRASGDSSSYTVSLLESGPARCAKKFGEEAVEAAIAGATSDKTALTEEAADVLYHLLVLMTAVGVTPDDVAAVLKKREGVSGLQEKASRKK